MKQYWRLNSAGWIVLLTCLTVKVAACRADDIIFEENGKKTEKSGTVKFENDELVILETSDGYWSRIIKSDIKERIAKPAPPLLKPDELGKQLQGDPAVMTNLRVKVTPNVIAVLVLEANLPDTYEEQAEKVLTQMIKSYDRTAAAVSEFAKKYKLPQKKPALPALITVYESATVAEKNYDREYHLSPGVSYLRNCGWYEPGMNMASFTLPEVLGWEGTPTDVLVWQQLFHTGMLRRQAPVPLWFLLGVSTGFDSSDTRVEPNHLKLSSVTYEGLRESNRVNWNKMVSDYEFYQTSDTFDFTQFRDQAWGLHWFLINKNKTAYLRYWKMMADLSPLESYSTPKDLADFKKAFGKEPEAFKPLFEKAFDTAARTPPPPLHPDDAFWYWKDQFGSAKMTWIPEAIATTEIRMDGTLTNISPLRARSFCVGFKTNQGKSAIWFVDKLEPMKSVELKAKRAEDAATLPNAEKKAKAEKPSKKAPNQEEHSVDSVWIKSARSDSAEAEKWRKGELPAPPDDDE